MYRDRNGMFVIVSMTLKSYLSSERENSIIDRDNTCVFRFVVSLLAIKTPSLITYKSNKATVYEGKYY